MIKKLKSKKSDFEVVISSSDDEFELPIDIDDLKIYKTDNNKLSDK